MFSTCMCSAFFELDDPQHIMALVRDAWYTLVFVKRPRRRAWDRSRRWGGSSWEAVSLARVDGALMESDARVAGGLQLMARAAGARAKPDQAAVADAEAQARAALIAKIAALPPRAIFSSEALRAFRSQHVEMNAYLLAANGPPQAGSSVLKPS